MAIWFVGFSIVLVWVVFQSPALDVRVVAAGALVPWLDALTLLGVSVVVFLMVRVVPGTVVDADSGEPLPGVNVCAAVGEFQDSCAASDGDGEYAVTRLRAGSATTPRTRPR